MQLLASFGAVAGGAGAMLYALDQSVQASGTEVHPAKMPWSHDGLISSFDHARYVRCPRSSDEIFVILYVCDLFMQSSAWVRSVQDRLCCVSLHAVYRLS